MTFTLIADIRLVDKKKKKEIPSRVFAANGGGAGA